MITMMMIIVTGIIMLVGFGVYMSYTIERERAIACHNEVVRELNRFERKLKDDSMRYVEREETKELYWELKVKAER